MHTILLCIATASVGIHAGWQRMPEGGMQYIIQLDPETLQSLREGAELGSDIPPSAGEVHSFKIVMGTKLLPHDTPPPPKAAPPHDEPQGTAAAGKPQPKATAEVQTEQPARPWLPLSFAIFGLFASLGANGFLGWIAWDSRRRYRAKCRAE
jgi:hypothetical protein